MNVCQKKKIQKRHCLFYLVLSFILISSFVPSKSDFCTRSANSNRHRTKRRQQQNLNSNELKATYLWAIFVLNFVLNNRQYSFGMECCEMLRTICLVSDIETGTTQTVHCENFCHLICFFSYIFWFWCILFSSSFTRWKGVYLSWFQTKSIMPFFKFCCRVLCFVFIVQLFFIRSIFFVMQKL